MNGKRKVRRWGILATGAMAFGLATACRSGERPPVASDPPQPAQVPPEPSPPKSPAPAEAHANPQGGPPAFANNAFPPAIPDSSAHRNAWAEDCLRCHETGVAEAPRVMHRSVPAVAVTGKCRTCHVEIQGHRMPERGAPPEDLAYLPNAFPPMIPASESHSDAWEKDSCLLCHEGGVKGAPIVRHEGMPALLLEAKCRSCHVQVRSMLVPEG